MISQIVDDIIAVTNTRTFEEALVQFKNSVESKRWNLSVLISPELQHEISAILSLFTQFI